MSKEWKVIRDDSVRETKSKVNTKAWDKAIKNTTSLKAFELKKLSEERYAANVERENQLVAAAGEKKLKSQRLIAEAEAIITEREKKAAKMAEKEKQVS